MNKPIIESKCLICGEAIFDEHSRKFCNWDCRAEWQRQQKPVTKEWLYQKYVVEGLSAPDIARIVNRDSKGVWSWLRGWKIPTRPRGADNSNHFKNGHNLNDGRTNSPETREKIRQARIREGSVPYLKNGVHHLKGKRGAETPNWKGGLTPQRQVFYQTPEWKAAVQGVWKRDNATCQRCGLHGTIARKQGISMDIHHIVGFEVVELRAVVTNLVLLCEPCHYWVHSRKNMAREFIGTAPSIRNAERASGQATLFSALDEEEEEVVV